MASWMIHLRIADKLLDKIPNLSPIEFLMGSMAPDSGVPNEEGTAFIPSTAISHYRVDDGKGKKIIEVHRYVEDYFTPEHRSSYNDSQYSFYLGYYTHLLADVLWSELVAWPVREQYPHATWEEIKEDWYDQDFLYIKKHPGFRAFRAYLGSVGFVNRYMDFFAPDAFDKRREYITSFYLQDKDNLDREYRYLTEASANQFVDDAVRRILARLEEPIYDLHPHDQKSPAPCI